MTLETNDIVLLRYNFTSVVTPQIPGVIFFSFFFYTLQIQYKTTFLLQGYMKHCIYFSYKYTNAYNILQEFDVQLFYTFTCQNILKLDCSNIFYKNASQGHNPAFSTG